MFSRSHKHVKNHSDHGLLTSVSEAHYDHAFTCGPRDVVHVLLVTTVPCSSHKSRISRAMLIKCSACIGLMGYVTCLDCMGHFTCNDCSACRLRVGPWSGTVPMRTTFENFHHSAHPRVSAWSVSHASLFGHIMMAIGRHRSSRYILAMLRTWALVPMY